MELSLAMMPSVVAINDVVLDVVFTTQETTEMEMPNIVWSVGGTAAGSRAIEATVSGIEICQSWKQATETDAKQGRRLTESSVPQSSTSATPIYLHQVFSDAPAPRRLRLVRLAEPGPLTASSR